MEAKESIHGGSNGCSEAGFGREGTLTERVWTVQTARWQWSTLEADASAESARVELHQ